MMLDRVSTVVEHDNNMVQTLQRAFAYDSYGNMWITQNSGVPLAGNALVSNNYDAATNRRGDQSYDGAGNQVSVNGDNMSYDAENRQIQAFDNTMQTTETYVYDGNGQRVQKSGPGGTVTFVYDAFGQLAAQYSGSQEQDYIWFNGQVAALENSDPAAPCATCYFSVDPLGSIRMITDENADIVSRHDFMPFGDEIPAGYAERDSSLGYGANDSVSQRFTGQYRDTETGVDYFNARYFGSALGRFTSPDPMNAGADASDPQTWNGYAYVRNNPLNAVDPSGLDPFYVAGCWYQTEAITTTFNGVSSTSYNTNIVGCDFSTGGSYLQLTGGGFQNPTSTSGGGGGAPAQPQQAQQQPNYAPAANSGNCVAGYTAAGAGLGAVGGYWAGGGVGALGGGAAGTAVEPVGGTAVGAFGGFQLGSGVGAAGGFALGARAGYVLGSILCSSSTGTGGGGGPQDRKLSASEVRQLEAETGESAHQIKAEALGTNKNIAQYDLYKDFQGNIFVKAKGGIGEAIPTGLRIR